MSSPGLSATFPFLLYLPNDSSRVEGDEDCLEQEAAPHTRTRSLITFLLTSAHNFLKDSSQDSSIEVLSNMNSISPISSSQCFRKTTAIIFPRHCLPTLPLLA